MFFKVIKIIHKKFNTKNILLFLLLTIITYALMMFCSLYDLSHYAKNLTILDIQPTGYDANYVKQLFDTIGSQGRIVYLYRQIPLDMLFLLSYSIFLSLFLYFLSKKTFEADSKFQYSVLLPIFTGLFDFIENIGIATMLIVYPDFYPWIAKTTSIVTIIKGILVISIVIIIIITVILLSIKTLIKLQN